MSGTKLSRRDFIRLTVAGAGAAVCPLAARAAEQKHPHLSDHEALAYKKLPGGKVLCQLCPRACTANDGQRGYCGVRENQGGVYKTLVYARPCSLQKDPIEKKPLFHVLPGTFAFSIATAGCNLECQFCQNWRLSQFLPEDLEPVYCPPDKVAEAAQKSKCKTIAYTYNEPTIFYEYMLDCARAGNKAGVRSVMISNGFINPEPMKVLCKELAAVKIDLKAFSEAFYRRYVRGELKPVLATLELLKKLGMHFEIVNLLIPALNDGEEDIKKMTGWVLEKLGADVPMHFTRFHPAYKMTNLTPTPLKSLERAREIAAKAGVHYAYTGNAPGLEYESTYCHNCGKKIISRYGMHASAVNIKDGKCEFCETKIPGVWK